MRARIQNGVVIEIIHPVGGFAIEDCFHPEVLAGSVPCDADTQVGWVLQADGSLAPGVSEPVETPEEPAP